MANFDDFTTNISGGTYNSYNISLKDFVLKNIDNIVCEYSNGYKITFTKYDNGIDCIEERMGVVDFLEKYIRFFKIREYFEEFDILPEKIHIEYHRDYPDYITITALYKDIVSITVIIFEDEHIFIHKTDLYSINKDNSLTFKCEYGFQYRVSYKAFGF